jgi:hypothetical protein
LNVALLPAHVFADVVLLSVIVGLLENSSNPGVAWLYAVLFVVSTQ